MPGSCHFHRQVAVVAAADTAAVEALNPCLVASCHCLDFWESSGLDSWDGNWSSFVVAVAGDRLLVTAAAFLHSELSHNSCLSGNMPINIYKL